MITIRSFFNPLEAYMARSLLESEGIEVILLDENLASVAPAYSNATGGVRLQVEENEADRAMAILDSQSARKTPSLLRADSKIARLIAILVIVTLAIAAAGTGIVGFLHR
ncbi:MAG TPA: hypothetical protein DD435_12710 [Cyanobacteria bacterium UBA8530]|nr:hypothetical protein [Cyanobacteria bacterium UBA8530]